MSNFEIAMRRMRNSKLTGTSLTAADEVVHWHGAMQAQDYGPAKWSVGQRALGLVDCDLDRAVEEGSIIRTHVLRPTWHFVARDDIRWLLRLTGPRVQQSTASRYRELGLDGRTLARCRTEIASALQGGNRLSRDEIAGVLDDTGIDKAGQRLPHILMHCELESVICSGGLRGKQQTYALLDSRVPDDQRFDRDGALIELSRRYLMSHGPATVKDLRWWSSLTVTDIKRALELLGAEVESETIDGLTFWSIASDKGAHSPRAHGVHLLQVYDELLVGYTESRYFGDPRAADARAAWRDRSLPNGIVLMNGGVAGHWRRSLQRDSVRIEALLYEHPKRGTLTSLEAAAEKLGRFVGRRVALQVKTL